MKTKIIAILAALLTAGAVSAHAGGLIEMIMGGGGDKGPQTNGKVTVKGLGRYDGKYVMGLSDSDPALLAAGNITSGGVITAAAIRGGKATLKVWQNDGDILGSFDGDVTSTLLLSIYDEEAPTDGVAKGLMEANFRKGSGSGTGAFIDGGAFGGIIDRAFDNVFDSAVSAAGYASSGGEADDSNTASDNGGLFSRIFGRIFGGGKESGSKESEETATAARGGKESGKESGKEESGADSDTASGGGGLFGGLFGGGSSGGGASLSFSNQQVYTFGVDIEEIMSGGGNYNLNDMYKHRAYSSSHSLSSNAGGSGSINKGRMSFSIGAPPNDVLEKVDTSTIATLRDYYASVKISNRDAKGVSLSMKTDNGKILQKQNQEGMDALIASGGSGTITMESVYYFYSDRACTVQLTGGKPIISGYKFKMPDMNISYKQGWNTVSLKMTMNLKTENISADIKLGDLSSCKWVINPDYTKL